MRNRNIHDVVEVLKDAKLRGKGAALLIGAGCSVTAGIPTAAQFVEIIKARYPQAFGRAVEPKSYASCMAELTPGQRRDLILSHINTAKINWAHMCIARLVQEGYVTRVLTVNFDPLVVRACALQGEFPAVYDLATSEHFKAAYIPDTAIFHLHGQSSGFVLLNTDEEFTRHSRRLGNVFEEAGQGRPWIVVGYSGENDPVFEKINTAEFDFGLFWVSYVDSEPAPRVRETLLSKDGGGFLIAGFDADSFFVCLAQGLGIFPPELVQRPFSHLVRLMDMLTPSYTIPRTPSSIDVMSIPRQWVLSAIEHFESPAVLPTLPQEASGTPDAVIAAAQHALMSGDYQAAIDLTRSHSVSTNDDPASEVLFWAYVSKGDSFSDGAQLATGAQADELVRLAGQAYGEACRVGPNHTEALYQWGVVLLNHAETKHGDEGLKLFTLAIQKFDEAWRRNPGLHQAANNIGVTLLRQAELVPDEQAAQYCRQSIEWFSKALNVAPDKYFALFNWGNALRRLAMMSDPAEASKLRGMAVDKYQATLQIQPQFAGALQNWANSMIDEAITQNEEEANRLYSRASEKFEEAYIIDPDNDDVLLDWGRAIATQAESSKGSSVAELFELAYGKFAEALACNPRNHEVLFQWARALDAQAQLTSSLEVAEGLYQQARKRFEDALTLCNDWHKALDALGNTLLHLATIRNGAEAERLYRSAEAYYKKALDQKPDRSESMYNWGTLLLTEASTKPARAADALLAAASDKFQDATQVQPEMYQAYYNWGMTCERRAALRNGIEAAKLYAAAAEKYGHAVALKPDMTNALNKWGLALFYQGTLSAQDYALELFRLAGDKFRQAHIFAPERVDTLVNWASTLAEEAKRVDGSSATKLYDMAIEKLEAALRLQPENQVATANLQMVMVERADVEPMCGPHGETVSE